MAMFVMERDEMSIFYRGPSIDASYQISDYWLCGFRGEDDGRRMPSDGKSSHCLWQGELTKNVMRKKIPFISPCISAHD